MAIYKNRTDLHMHTNSSFDGNYPAAEMCEAAIANAIASTLQKPYRMLNATINNKQDFDIVIEEAKMNGEMIIIMDEIHRLNKDKQDLLLPYIENGLIILIGMTTSNPYHKINPAIEADVKYSN